MKKIVPVIIVLAAVAAGAFVFLKRSEPHRSRAAELAPAETIFFAQLPDLSRSVKRFERTSLHALWLEPEVQAFLEQPLRTMPMLVQMGEKREQLLRIAPREVFVAMTSLDGTTPKFVAGMAFSGSRTEVEKLMAEPRARLKKTWPAGKADLVNYGASEIEVFTWQGGAMADSFRGIWYLVANDIDLLKATLDRVDGKGGPALSGSEAFRKVTAPLPTDADMLVVAQPGALTDRLGSLMAAAGAKVDAKAVASAAKSEGMAYAAKIDGAQMRDVIFIPGSGAKETPLPRSTLALSTADTFLYYAMAVPAQIQLPEGAAMVVDLLGPSLDPMDKALAEKGLKWADFGVVFGPEFGSLVDWGEEEDAPMFLLALDVREVAKAKTFLDVLTGSSLGGVAWGRREENGVTLYQMPGEGLAVTTPSLALTEKFLVLGLSPEAVQLGLARLASGEATIGQSAGYQTVARQVGEPTSGYGYLDLRTLFERSYGMLRPFFGMSLAFAGETGQFIDAGKLPSTDAIGKHLSPIVFTQSANEQGTLMESVGPMTISQAFATALAGLGASVFPSMDSVMALDPSQLLQQLSPGTSLPGLGPKQPKPEALSEPKPPGEK